MHFGVFLEGELRVGLVAFGREADVVKLDLVHTRRGNVFGQGYVVILDFLMGAVRPDQLAVLAPRLVQASGLDSQRTMVLGDIIVPEERLARDYVHIQRMQE